MARKQDNSLMSPRIRFNWGYHAGASDVRTGHTQTRFQSAGNGLSKKAADAYREAYALGRRDQHEGTYHGCSEEAYVEYTEDKPQACVCRIPEFSGFGPIVRLTDRGVVTI
jgi:hypothetical protein